MDRRSLLVKNQASAVIYLHHFASSRVKYTTYPTGERASRMPVSAMAQVQSNWLCESQFTWMNCTEIRKKEIKWFQHHGHFSELIQIQTTINGQSSKSIGNPSENPGFQLLGRAFPSSPWGARPIPARKETVEPGDVTSYSNKHMFLIWEVMGKEPDRMNI